MFFYMEKTPVALSTSVSSLSFSNIAVNSSSSLTFTVNSTGEATETITLSDDSNQFDFSPSTFSLTGGSSQVVTANFRPTLSALKTGTVTISAAGGSVKTVAVSGSATNYVTVVTGTAYAALMYSDRAPGRKPPTGTGPFPTGSTGWFFQNTTTTGVSSSINWYYYSDSLTNSASLGSLTCGYTIITMNTHSAVSASHHPFLTVFTYPQPADIAAGGWFQSRLSYEMTASATPGVTYLMYFGQDPVEIRPELPRLYLPLNTNPGTRLRGTFGPRGSNEIIYTAGLFTSAVSGSAASANLNKCVIVSEGMGYRTSNGTGSWQAVTLQS